MKQRLFEPFIFLYITEYCQLRCKHCYMGDRLESKKMLSVDDIYSFLKYMKGMHGHYKVYILGGEPTTHPNFIDIIKLCSDLEYKTVVTSNGLISEKIWNSIKNSSFDSFSFSIDGSSAEIHEKQRGKNTFSRLILSIKRAVELGFQTRLITTITRDNINDIENLIELSLELNVPQLCLHYFTPTGLGKNMPELQLKPEEWIDFCDRLSAIYIPDQLELFYPPAFIRETELSTLIDKGYPGCTARNLERVAYFPDGRLYLCSAFFDTNLNFATYDGEKLHIKHETTELDLVSTLEKNCVKCGALPACKGGCAAYEYLSHPNGRKTSECESNIIPVCPLWSMPLRTTTNMKLYDLR